MEPEMEMAFDHFLEYLGLLNIVSSRELQSTTEPESRHHIKSHCFYREQIAQGKRPVH